MRKIALVILAVLFLTCANAVAGGVGNCVQSVKKTTDHLGVGAAFEYNYVHDRMNKLENKRGPRSMKMENVNQVYGKGIIGLSDHVNFYGKIGGSDYDLEFVDQAQGTKITVDLEDGVYTGAGINALFPLTEIAPVSLGIGFDIQSNFFYNKVKGMVRRNETARNVAGTFYGVDGQNSLYMTFEYDIDILKTSIVPYVGGYHSWLVMGTAESLTYTTNIDGYDREDFQAAFDFLSFGVVFGVDVDIAKYINLNIEGRLVGETALTTGATIKF